MDKMSKTIFDKISFWILASMAFLLPLVFISDTLMPLAQVKFVVFVFGVALALIAFLVDRLRQGPITFSFHYLHFFLPLLLLVYLASSLLSIGVYNSFLGSFIAQDTFVFMAFSLVLVFLVSQLCVESPKRMWILLLAPLLSASIVGIFQLFRIFVGDALSLAVLRVPTLTLAGSWNDMTIFMLLILVTLVVVFELIPIKKNIKLWLSPLFIVSAFFILLSGLGIDLYFFTLSLRVLIVVASLILFTYMFSLYRFEPKAKVVEGVTVNNINKFPFPSLAVCVVSVLLLFFGSFISNYIGNTFNLLFVEGRPTWQSTTSIAYEGIKSNRFLGTGPNTFSYEWNLLKPLAVNNTQFWNTDLSFGVGIFPTSAITIGPIGFILWLAFYLWLTFLSIKKVFQLNWKEKASIVKALIIFSFFITTIFVWCHAPGIAVVGIHFFFVGLVLALISTKKTKGINLHKSQMSSFAATFSISILVISLLLSLYQIGTATVAMVYMNKSFQTLDSKQAITLASKAVMLDGDSSLNLRALSRAYASDVSRIAQLSKEKLELEKEDLKNGIVNAVKISVDAENANRDYQSMIATGRILDFFGTLGVPNAFKEAEAKYLEASKLNPNNPLPYIFASNASFTQGNEIAARDYMIKALSLKADYSDVPDLGRDISNLAKLIDEKLLDNSSTATTSDEKEDSTDEE